MRRAQIKIENGQVSLKKLKDFFFLLKLEPSSYICSDSFTGRICELPVDSARAGGLVAEHILCKSYETKYLWR